MPIPKEVQLRLTEINEQINEHHASIQALNDEKRSLMRQCGTMSTEDKVELFFARFKGREDRYAVKWNNEVKGTSGYSPVCSNLWVPGVCEKKNNTRFKCQDCTKRALQPLTKDVVYEHLSGKKEIGAYPLQDDNRTSFLAFDFDKTNFKEEALAVRQACKALEVESLLEISQSGQGAHVWVFFDKPVAAFMARKLGFLLLNKAIDYYPYLSFESFDRLFPAQDRLPDYGDFGNLIHLPLYLPARSRGCTVFVDDNFAPLEDQWHALEQVGLTTKNQLLELNLESLKDQKIPNPSGEGEAFMPWDSFLPAKAHQQNGPIHEAVEITCTEANMLFVPTESIPKTLVIQIRRLASMSNPEFFKARATGRNTYNLPRFLCFAQHFDKYLAIPRGLKEELIGMCAEFNVSIEWEDKRTKGAVLDSVHFLGSLRRDQPDVVAELLKYDYGVLKAPTAFGKTIASIAMIARRKVNSLILVNTSEMAEQWVKKLNKYLGGCEIGYRYKTKSKLTGQVDVVTYQSLVENQTNEISEIAYQYGFILVDECHHGSSPQYQALLESISPIFMLGVSATTRRRDGLEKLVFLQLGKIRAKGKEQEDRHAKHVIYRKTASVPPKEWSEDGFKMHSSKIYEWLMNDAERNQMIVDDVLHCVTRGRHPIIITERREHAITLRDMLSKASITTSLLIGQMKAKELKESKANLETAQVVVCTGKYIGESFDHPRLDTVFVGLPIAWKGMLEQYTGRINREYEGKGDICAYDYVDTGVGTVDRWARLRKTGYKSLKHVDIAIEESSMLFDVPE